MPNEKDTLTRASLSDAVQQKTSLSLAESATMVDAVLETLLETLEQRENIKISSFGSFVVCQKKERVGRNPKTGKEAKITERHVLSFRPSNLLKDEINKHLAS